MIHQIHDQACPALDSHNALLIPREAGPYAGINFEKLQQALNQLTNNGRCVDPIYLKDPKASGNFKLVPIPLRADQFIMPVLEELQTAFRIREVESLARKWSKDPDLRLDRSSLQVNILTDGNESHRHEHRQADGRKWALVTMLYRKDIEGSIFWTEEPALMPGSRGPQLMRDLQPGDSIFFDASTYHGSTLTRGKGMVARAAWGFS